MTDISGQRVTTSNYEKHQTGNPLMRKLIRRFEDRVYDLAQSFAPVRVVDLGCGEGFTAMALRQRGMKFQYLGLERDQFALALAREQAPDERFEYADILTREPDLQWADLAICLEVLEHMTRPQDALTRIAQWTAGKAIISVPWEPWFQLGNLCRGKYLGTLGNHPEHIQKFSVGSFKRLLSQYFRDVAIETCFPWIIAVVEKPHENY
jgi:2-polyprenyl-3-methyl-5-hydroxy-6-metoxy-1,4-benzoquinol methylase